MPQHEHQVRQRPFREAGKGAHTPRQPLSPEELALLRSARQSDARAGANPAFGLLARQIGNRAMSAYIARAPEDEDLDALLGGGPPAPAAETAAPTAATEQPAAETSPAAPTGATEQAAATAEAAPTTPEQAGAVKEAAGQEPASKASPDKASASGFEPKKGPFAGAIPPKPVPQVAGGLRPNPFEAKEASIGGAPGGPEAAAQGEVSASAGAETQQAPPETGRAPEAAQTESAANQAEEQGQAQAESAGHDVEQAASTGQAEVGQAEERAESQAATPTSAQPVAGAAQREPSWLGRAREALSRVLGHIRRGVGVVTDRTRNLGTRIHDLAQRGVQEATRIIRQVGVSIGTAVNAVLSRLHGMVAAIISRATQIAGEIRAAAARAVNFVLSLLGNIGERIRTGVRNFLANAYRRVVPIVRAVRETASRLLNQLTQRVVAAITQRAEQVRHALRAAVQFVIGRITGVRSGARSIIERLLGGENPLPERAHDWLRRQVQRLGQPILDAAARVVGNATTRVIGRLRSVFTTVATPLRSAWNLARNLLQAHVLPVIAPAREYAPEIAAEVDLGMSDAEAAAETVTGAIDAQVASTEAAVQGESANLQAAISGSAEA